MKFIPYRTDGDKTPIEAKKFKHRIGDQEHWFCVHESIEYYNRWAVSDWASGYRVQYIDFLTLQACRGDVKAAARMTLDKLVERLGASRVLEVLRNVPKRS